MAERARKALLDARAAGAPPVAQARAAMSVVAPAVRDHLTHAPDADVVRAFRDYIAVLEGVRATDPSVCGRFVIGGGQNADRSPAWQELGRASAQLMNDLAESGMDASISAPLQSITAERDLETVVARLHQRYGDDVQLLGTAPASLPADRLARACQIGIGLYREVLSLDTASAGNLLKYLFFKRMSLGT